MPLVLRTLLKAEAQHGTPNEVCGVLGGTWHGWVGYAKCYIAVPNCSSAPHSHFVMEHSAMVAAAMALRRARYDLIGIYHSHPHSAPVPSPADLAECTWHATPYVIVGYAAVQPLLAAWLIEGTNFTHLPLI
ncbi:MAG: Mov34/MPN/PAD-1 family protein [Aggregatilineales bacterium]